MISNFNLYKQINQSIKNFKFKKNSDKGGPIPQRAMRHYPPPNQQMQQGGNANNFPESVNSNNR